MNKRKSEEDKHQKQASLSEKEIPDSSDAPSTATQKKSERGDLELSATAPNSDKIEENSPKEVIEGGERKEPARQSGFDAMYIEKTLRHYPWYHGLILSQHVRFVLKWDTSFVVRRSGEEKEEFFCMSFRNQNAIHHYAFRHDNGFWTCPKLVIPDMEKNVKFQHIHSIINYWSNKINGVTPVPRSKLTLYHEDVKLIKKLGHGEFGEVWEGTLTIEGGTTRKCAVKKIKGQVNREQIASFFHESHIMGLLDHDCVVKFYGQCTLASPLMALMELAKGGTVRSYLRSNKQVPIDMMIGFVNDIARGMEHLTSKVVIHRDLAARNCLIGDNMVVKVSDFGLSIQAEEKRVKTLKQAPMRWLAPETLTHGIFNEKTDVWSFGVVIWEIFTYCAHHPLYPKTMKDACAEIKQIDRPHRFDLGTKLPPKEIISIMDSCTRKMAAHRPKFRILVMEIAKFFEMRKRAASSKKRNKTKTRNNNSGSHNNNNNNNMRVPRGMLMSNRRKPKFDKSEPTNSATTTTTTTTTTGSKSAEKTCEQQRVLPMATTPKNPVGTPKDAARKQRC